jgi:hypothetical protein
MNTIECKRKRSKINKAGRYAAAHSDLLAGSALAGPAVKSGGY